MLADRFKPNEEVTAAQDKHSAEPALAAIVVVPGKYDTVRCTMSHLQAQTVVKQIEIIFVTPSHKQLRPEESELAPFHSWHVVEIGRVTSIAHGYATGIHHAHAPIVALTQDHAFPDNKWAELFVAAHKQHWAVVGPKMGNGNPNTMISWADFYMSYGEWAHPASSGAVRHLPGHNSSYKRDILLENTNELENLLEAESVFHRRLNAQGYELMLESGTCTLHLNYATWSSWLKKRYYQGRQFASTWARSWSWARRLLFIAATPIIPCVRLWRLQRHIRRGQAFSFLIFLMPALLLGLLAEGIGHMIGYTAGPGNCIEKVTKYEFDRMKHVKLI
jgi:GT2 family glycosyltransferase